MTPDDGRGRHLAGQPTRGSITTTGSVPARNRGHSIVVPVDGSPESRQPLELAGLLAAAHGGTVTLIAAPACDLGLQRAIAASFSVLLRATGTAPHVMAEPRPPDRVIPSAAATLKASLVVLDSGRNPAERRMAALMVGAIGCSVLAVPRS